MKSVSGANQIESPTQTYEQFNNIHYKRIKNVWCDASCTRRRTHLPKASEMSLCGAACLSICRFWVEKHRISSGRKVFSTGIYCIWCVQSGNTIG